MEDEVRHKFISSVKDGSNIENKLCNYYLQTFFELPIRLKFLIKITFSKVTWSSWLNTRNSGMHFAKLTTFLMAGVKHSENSSEIFAPSAVSGFGLNGHACKSKIFNHWCSAANRPRSFRMNSQYFEEMLSLRDQGGGSLNNPFLNLVSKF